MNGSRIYNDPIYVPFQALTVIIKTDFLCALPLVVIQSPFEVLNRPSIKEVQMIAYANEIFPRMHPFLG